jgi:hypothetical protein
MRLSTLIVAATAATLLCAGQGLAQAPTRSDPSSTPGQQTGQPTDTITVDLAMKDNGPDTPSSKGRR